MKTFEITLAITELNKAFSFFNETFFKNELPTPIITIQHQGNRKNILGWFTLMEIWTNNEQTQKNYEINITAEYMNRPIKEILCTMMHEMIHLYCRINNIQDVSRNGYYHNIRFQKACNEHGLDTHKDTKLGYSHTTFKKEHAELPIFTSINSEAFSMSRRPELAGGKKKSSIRKYVCPKCRNIARTTKVTNSLYCSCGISEDEITELDEFTRMLLEESEDDNKD